MVDNVGLRGNAFSTRAPLLPPPWISPLIGLGQLLSPTAAESPLASTAQCVGQKGVVGIHQAGLCRETGEERQVGAELPCAIGILEGIVVAVVLVIVTNLGPYVVTELVVKLLLVVHPPKTESGKALAGRLSSSSVARGDESSCRRQNRKSERSLLVGRRFFSTDFLDLRGGQTRSLHRCRGVQGTGLSFKRLARPREAVQQRIFLGREACFPGGSLYLYERRRSRERRGGALAGHGLDEYASQPLHVQEGRR